jgi:ribose transport system substrate-binding protein
MLHPTKESMSPPATIRSRKYRVLGLSVTAVLIGGLALAGCSSSQPAAPAGNSADQSTTPASSPAAGFNPTSVLQQAFAGVKYPVPKTGPKAQTGKNIWVLNCLSYPICQEVESPLQTAAKALGWKITARDTKLDPTTGIALIRQAVAAKADGIIEVSQDCAQIKAGLQAAKAAGIPVVAWGAVDCNDPSLGSAKSAGLFTSVAGTLGTSTNVQLFARDGEEDANVLVARAQQAGIAAPKILNLASVSFQYEVAETKAFTDRVAQICPACKIDTVDLTSADLGTPAGEQLIKTAVLGHPADNVVFYPLDTIMAYGLNSALQGSNIKVACCGDNADGGASFVKNTNVAVTENYVDLNYVGYAIADAMNRVLAGDPPVDEGGFIKYFDRTHSPAAPANFDYAAQFTQLWESGSSA